MSNQNRDDNEADTPTPVDPVEQPEVPPSGDHIEPVQGGPYLPSDDPMPDPEGRAHGSSGLDING